MTLETNTNSDTAMFRSVIDGLYDLDADLLLTIGYGNDPAAIGRLSANAHVENYLIGDLLVASGAGLVLTPADVSPSTVRAGVITLLESDDPGLRAAARR